MSPADIRSYCQKATEQTEAQLARKDQILKNFDAILAEWDEEPPTE